MEFTVRVLIWFNNSLYILNNIQRGNKSDVQRGGITDKSEDRFIDTDGFMYRYSFAFQDR